MKRIIIFLAIVLFLSYMGGSCKKCTPLMHSDNPCDSISHTFATDILPIFTTSCATSSGCHANGSINSGGPLTNYTQISAKASVIQIQVNSNNMPPPPSTLSTEQKNKINCWIDNGAPND